MPSDVDDYMAEIPEGLRAVAANVRGLIVEELPHTEEALLWSRPTYKVNGKHVCYIAASKAHVTLGFTQGQSLTDPQGQLEGEGKQMAHVKLRQLSDVDEQRLRGWLQQAGALAQQE